MLDSLGAPPDPDAAEATAVLFPLALMQGGGAAKGVVAVGDPVPANTGEHSAADDDAATLDAGGGIEMFGLNGAPSAEALATSGPLHARLLQRCADLYRALYVKKGVPAAMIDGILANQAGSLSGATIYALVVSLIPTLKQQLL